MYITTNRFKGNDINMDYDGTYSLEEEIWTNNNTSETAMELSFSVADEEDGNANMGHEDNNENLDNDTDSESESLNKQDELQAIQEEKRKHCNS
uniref:Uncharacterized protein n=1 Tax=Arundo donax TaxID=35708 RepID=A0A0A9DBL8_ARUDO